MVGRSAGGVEGGWSELVGGLPPGLPAAIFVVCHFPPEGRSRLPDILSRGGSLLANHAHDDEPSYPGQIYVAPPGQHLVLEPGVVRLTHDPRESRFHPAIDPLFRSAARVYGRRVIAVLLSGAMADGVAGLLDVRANGGVAVLQDPRDALQAALPQIANDVVGADYIVPIRALAALLVRLVHEPMDGQKSKTPTRDSEPSPSTSDGSSEENHSS